MFIGTMPYRKGELRRSARFSGNPKRSSCRTYGAENGIAYGAFSINILRLTALKSWSN